MRPGIVALAILAIVGLVAIVTWGPDQSTPIISLATAALAAIAGLAGYNLKAPNEQKNPPGK